MEDRKINQYNLEKTLIMDCVGLFAIVAKFDDVVTDEEREYVRQYLKILYNDEITDYLMDRFDAAVAGDIDAGEVVEKIAEDFSYENKIFFGLKIYELISADEIEEDELRKADELFKKLGIEKEDAEIVKSIFVERDFAKRRQSDDARVQTLSVGSAERTPDIVVPAPNANALLLKVDDLLCLVHRGEGGEATMNELDVAPDFALKVQQGQAICLGGYAIRYDDLNLLFELTRQSLTEKRLFIKREPNAIVVDSKDTGELASEIVFRGLEVVAEIIFDGLLTKIRSLDDETPIEVNGERVEHERIVNLGDEVTVGGFDLNVRRVFVEYRLGREDYAIDPDKTTYVISNGPGADIHLYDDHPTVWECRLVSKNGSMHFEKDNCPHETHLNEKEVSKRADCHQDDYLFIDENVFLFDFHHKKIRKSIFTIKNIVAEDLRYRFSDNTVGIDDVSFEVTKGDLVGVIGPSGCGKSTLLNIINGYFRPNEGEIRVNDYNLLKYYDNIKDYIGYVPQDDLLFDNLTVYENLYYYAKLRFPEKPKDKIETTVRRVLHDIELHEKRDIKVGNPLSKTLSGGQRKRLNIGLELLSDAEILFLDEPTSGLSSKDSEKIVALMQRLALKGKIVFSVIHQPSAKIYKMFKKVVLLDKGGKLAFFGETLTALRYFQEHQRQFDSDSEQGVEMAFDPDQLLDRLEEPIRDIDGSKLALRKFSPDYWKEYFKKRRESVREADVVPEVAAPIPPHRGKGFGRQWSQFVTLFNRNFRNKLRDSTNLVITFLGAPLLSVIIAFILKYRPPEQDYTLYSNMHFKTFVFLAVIVSLFFAISNSVDEIVKDAAIRLREKILDVKNRSYYASKFLTQTIFALIQNALFVVIGFVILDVRELYLEYIGFLTIVSFSGIAIGLLVSSFPNLSAKAASNLVPIILIPQIIFGGALIPYEEMNEKLKIDRTDQIPELCHLMTSRWAYEGLMTMQFSFNGFHPVVEELTHKKERLVKERAQIVKAKGEKTFQEVFTQVNDKLKYVRENYRDLYGNATINKDVRYANIEFKQDVEHAAKTGEDPKN
ncbi:MAG: ATP-binding cassette domain-containing protein, partial [Ignavibacteriales bacterium]|nr:ATP-binding cassette domain-containing protein [Ignavibacteriales bacterium]